MESFLRIAEEPDLVLTIVLCAIAHMIGNWAIEANPNCRAWGFRIAALAFICYVGFRYLEEMPEENGLIVAMVVRGLLVGWLVLGLSWVVLKLAAIPIEEVILPLWYRWRISAERKRLEEIQARNDAEAERNARMRVPPKKKTKAEKVAEMLAEQNAVVDALKQAGDRDQIVKVRTTDVARIYSEKIHNAVAKEEN